MQEKHTFIVVHNYGMGSIGMRIFARELAEVEMLFPSREWEVKSQSEMPSYIDWSQVELLESDVDHKELWLLRLIESFRQTQLGKEAFIVRARYQGKLVFRQVYARNWDEISTRYPELESMIGKILTGEAIKDVGFSDIDDPDDFLSNFDLSK